MHELALQKFLVTGAQGEIFRSAHDLSEGGLALALAECLLGERDHPKGCQVSLGWGKHLRTDSLLFGETQGRVIVSVTPELETAFKNLAKSYKLPVYLLGRVGGVSLKLDEYFEIPSTEIETTYRNAIGRRMQI
jgi:phosphoribosylformylglycinamidine synthase